MSGGGVYQVKLIEERGHKSVGEFMFAGVFVGDDGDQYLASRGHISLYEVFCEYLDGHIDKNS